MRWPQRVPAIRAPSDSHSSSDHDRSGPTVDEAVTKAETGSQVDGVHAPAGPGDIGDSRREQIRDIGGATEDTVDRNPGEPATPPEPRLSPTETGSGGAQNIAGARISDRVAAGQPLPDEPPFDSHSEGDTRNSSGGGK
jgi:hypothetical protein